MILHVRLLVLCIMVLAIAAIGRCYVANLDPYKPACVGEDCSYKVSKCRSDNCNCEELYVTRLRKECYGWFLWKHCADASAPDPEKFKCFIPHAHDCQSSEWSECSKSCGAGEKTRQITHIREGTPEQPCLSTTETESEPCNEEECPTISSCSSLTPEVFINEIVVREDASIDVELVAVYHSGLDDLYELQIFDLGSPNILQFSTGRFVDSQGIGYATVSVPVIGLTTLLSFIVYEKATSNQLDDVTFDTILPPDFIGPPNFTMFPYVENKSVYRTGIGCNKDDFGTIEESSSNTLGEQNANQLFQPGSA